MTRKSDEKFDEALILSSENDMRKLLNFNANNSKSKNVHFGVLLLPKVYYV